MGRTRRKYESVPGSAVGGFLLYPDTDKNQCVRPSADVRDHEKCNCGIYGEDGRISDVSSGYGDRIVMQWRCDDADRLLADPTDPASDAGYRKMAEGEYSYRAEQISNDEMGQLTADFNHMAEALEQNIQNLENEVRAREDFIAAFSHELKTPLTAIIGYADMLRSRKLDEEKHFLCANYIYTEGKRLETMALRLLDIIVTRRKEIDRKTTNVSGIFSYLQEIYDETKNSEDSRVKVDICWEKGELYAEENLLKTVLINLTDNAIKASEEGQTVEITGRHMENGYYFQVRDEGIGIPEEELHKITEAFYMVDKSRSRAHNGAGLGLALCTAILELHHSSLKIESTQGFGSCMSFLIPDEGVKSDE